MKNIFFTLLLTCSAVSLSATAVLCNADGSFCSEVTQLNMGGSGWQNACCHHIPFTGNCTDDCDPPGPVASAPPGPHLGFNFNSVPSNFTTEDGNDVWIFDDDEHLPAEFGEGDVEYDVIMNLDNYSFLDESSEIQYVLIKINNSRTAVVSKLNNPLIRKKSQTSNSIISNDQIVIFPNPTKSGSVVTFKGLANISVATIYDVKGRLIHSLNIIDNGSVYKIPESLNDGVYFVRFYGDEGESIIKKIVVN